MKKVNQMLSDCVRYVFLSFSFAFFKSAQLLFLSVGNKSEHYATHIPDGLPEAGYWSRNVNVFKYVFFSLTKVAR